METMEAEKPKAAPETYRYHQSLVTAENPMGGKIYLTATAPVAGENGWSDKPIPSAQGIPPAETGAIATTAAMNMESEIAKAYARGVANTEAKVAEANRLGYVEARNEFAEEITHLKADVAQAHDAGFNKGVVKGKESAPTASTVYNSGYKDADEHESAMEAIRAKAHEEGGNSVRHEYELLMKEETEKNNKQAYASGYAKGKADAKPSKKKGTRNAKKG